MMSNSNASAAVQPSRAAIEHATVATGVPYEKLVAAFEAELGRFDPAAAKALVVPWSGSGKRAGAAWWHTWTHDRRQCQSGCDHLAIRQTKALHALSRRQSCDRRQ